MDQPKLERQLRLMMLLILNRQYTIDQIAKRLETTSRTVYRYLETLSDAGFIVKKWQNKYYYLDKDSKYFKEISELIHFTKEEALILKEAIESIDENTQIKQNLKKKLYTVYDYHILPEIVIHKEMTAKVSKLRNAIENHKQVRLLEYRSSNSKQISDRLVEPFSFTTNFIQVWCYEPSAQSNKLFRISRIAEVEEKGDWKFEELHSESNIDLFRISTSERYLVTLRLGLKASNLLREEFPLSEKVLQPDGENHSLLQTEVCSYDGIGRFVMGLLDDIEVIDSPGFVTFLKEKIKTSSNILNKWK